MTEIVLTLTPGQIRAAADLTGSSRDAAARARAAELREIAARVEADGSYTVVRPAYRVTYRPPRADATAGK